MALYSIDSFKLRLLFAFVSLLALSHAIAKDPPGYSSPSTVTRHPTTQREVTFGLEAEFVEEHERILDPGTMEVNLERFPFLYPKAHREPLFVKEPTGIEAQHNLMNRTGNWEVNTLPVSTLDASIHQGEQIREALAIAQPEKNRKNGMRGYHMHIRIPKEFLESLPEEERDRTMKALASALSEEILFHRLVPPNGVKSDPFIALGSPVQQRVRPEHADEKMGTTRMIIENDYYDFEIRGARADLDYLKGIAENVVHAVRNPQAMAAGAANWNLMEALHLPTHHTLEEFLTDQSKPLTAFERQVLTHLEGASPMRALPLYPYDEFPLFSEEQKSRIAAQTLQFKRELYKMLKDNAGKSVDPSALKDQYRRMQQKWAIESGIRDAIAEAMLPTAQSKLDPKKLADFHFGHVMRGLRSNVSETRLQAARAIEGARGPHLYKLVEAALAHPAELIQLEAVRALERRTDSESLEIVKRLVEDPQRSVELKRAALLTLADHSSPQALALLEKHVHVGKLIYWEAVLEALGKKSAEKGVDEAKFEIMQKLYMQLKDLKSQGLLTRPMEDSIMKQFIEALKGRSDEASLKLIRELSAEGSSVQAAAALLGRKDRKSIEYIATQWAAVSQTKPLPEVGPSLVLALSGRTEPEALALLAEMARHPDPLIRKRVPEVLATLPYAQSRTLLLELAHDKKPEVRMNAILAAGKIENPDAIEILEEGLKDSLEGIRRQAFDELLHNSDGRAIDLIEKIIQAQNARQTEPWLSRLKQIVGLSRGPESGPRHLDEETRNQAVNRVREHHSISSNDCSRGLGLLRHSP